LSGRGLLITGTDTGVGKTVVAAGLARALRERGHDVGVMKPAETGWAPGRGPWPTDADRLREAAGVDDPPDLVVPWIFEPPVAPIVAARAAGEADLLSRIVRRYRRLAARHTVLLVEGAGGLGVPIDDGDDGPRDYADLALALGLPLVIVARAHLGTVNHTFLTVRYARDRGLEVLGIVVNGLDRTRADPSAASNPGLVQERCGVPVWGPVPRLEASPTVEACADLVRDHVDLSALSRALDLAPTSREGARP